MLYLHCVIKPKLDVEDAVKNGSLSPCMVAIYPDFHLDFFRMDRT